MSILRDPVLFDTVARGFLLVVVGCCLAWLYMILASKAAYFVYSRNDISSDKATLYGLIWPLLVLESILFTLISWAYQLVGLLAHFLVPLPGIRRAWAIWVKASTGADSYWSQANDGVRSPVRTE